MSTLLIIDDDYVVLDLLREALTLEGFDIVSASSGLEGLEKLIKGKPDLVLLDIMMPHLDGYEVCKKIKQSPSTSNIPIIFVSAKAQPEDIEIGVSLGADDYVTKPFDFKDLAQRIRSVLEKYGRK